jgi:peptidoglycan/xylan/chitin deacetylase (PgdA/CDA1 family)
VAAPQLCHLHPTRTARRRCFQCGRPICRECQMRVRGHFFCGAACEAAQLALVRTERLQAIAAHPLRGKYGRLAVWVLFSAGALTLLWVSIRLPESLVPLPVSEKGKVVFAMKVKAPDLRSGAEIAIEEPAAATTVMTPEVTLRGRAPAGSMVGVYVENEPVQAVYCADGHWEIPGVPLSERVNVIQARYFDNAARSGFSPALKLLFAGRFSQAPGAASSPGAPLETGAYDLSRGPHDQKKLMLTFDGGSDEDAEAPLILDILKREKVRATLFLTGQFVEQHPDLVKRALAEGHEIGNHSDTHPHLTTIAFNGRQNTLAGIDRAFLVRQLKTADDKYFALTGRHFSPYWRAPFGEHNPEIRGWAYAAGFTHVGWSTGLDTLDWENDPTSKLFHTPEEMRSKILEREAAGGLTGGIILMHLGTGRTAAEGTPVILPGLIEELRARGYSFSTASEMLINAEAGSAPR